jgi:ssDNA thymidine ADP-ribosyltransferase DarT-like protein
MAESRQTMPLRPEERLIYHITDLENLTNILEEGGLLSDGVMSERNPAIIGYIHIKYRRLTQIRVPSCGDRFVGEFVPFYFCARSPMLYTVNLGKTGRPPGCQRTIIHLVSRVGEAIKLGNPWAVSDGNASAFHTTFDSTLQAIDNLDWKAIEARYWADCIHQKQAEFLVADFFPWTRFHAIGCYDDTAEAAVNALLAPQNHRPKVSVETAWYY